MVVASVRRRAMRLSLVSVAALLSGPTLALSDTVAGSGSPLTWLPPVPVLSCTGPDCAAGEGLLGDAPAHMSDIVEADLGLTIPEGPGDCGEGGCDGEFEYEDDETYDIPAGEAPEGPDDPPGATGDGSGVAEAIDAAREHCSTYSIHWRVDCLSSELRAAADRLSDRGDGAAIKAELIKASDELAQIAAANAYAAQPPVVRRTEVNGAAKRTARPIRSIAAARLPAANAAATAVLDNLSTTLLRSAPSAAARKANFERASQAVDSAKILLRSA